MYCLVWIGLGFGFLIWVGIHLFGAVDPMGALSEGEYRWIGVGFGPGGIQDKEREGWVILL